MEDRFIEENVRTRLILSGITELEEHGISDFSLRRAAVLAQVSCAAPYRHFKDKDEYIGEIIKYANSKWELLYREIERIFCDDKRKLAIETCMASLRFRIANKNFSTVFSLAAQNGAHSMIDDAIISSVDAYAASRGLSDGERELKRYSVRALVAGTILLASDISGEKTLELAKRKLEEEFL